jgi:hypothetical protein
MTSEPRRRFMEPSQPPRTPEEARQRRSTRMIGIGAIALAWGLLVVALGGMAGFVLVLLGIGLLVGGLVIRR